MEWPPTTSGLGTLGSKEMAAHGCLLRFYYFDESVKCNSPSWNMPREGQGHYEIHTILVKRKIHTDYCT